MSKNLKLFTDDASRQTYEQSQEYLEPYVGGVSSSQTSSYNKQNIGKYFIDYTRTEHRLSDFDINNKDVIEVEYLESNGTAYIDTGIKCTSKLKVQFEALVTTDVNKAVCGGISNASGSTYFRHHWTPSQSNFYWIQRSSANTSSVTFNYSTNTWYNVIIDPVNGTAQINNTSKTFTKITGLYTTNQNYFIFARKAENGDMQSRPSKFKSFKIWDDGILVRDMITVRVGNTGYMYDKVSRALFENVGTGNFVIGPDKYDAQIQYLESTGTQYIDTEFKHNQDTRFVAKFEVINNEYNQNKYLDPFGSWGDVKASSGTNYGKMKGLEWSKNSTHWHSYYGVIAKGKQLDTRIARFGIHTIDFNKRVHQMDSYSVTHDAQTFTSKYNDIIFGVTGYTGSVSYEFCFKYFYFQIYDNGTLVRDYIPVRKNNIGYMYDNVSRRLFSNAGSGQFILGPDVV